MTPVYLRDLTETPDLVPLIATWHHHQFGDLARASTIEQRIQRLQTHLHGDPIPKTFVAWAGDTPVGCAALVVNDMSILPVWSPWLAGVYVLPAQRGQGIGRQLVRRVTAEAAAQHVPRCYLYTRDRESFYTALGWRTLFTRLYRGYVMTIMALDLTTAQATSVAHQVLSNRLNPS